MELVSDDAKEYWADIILHGTDRYIYYLAEMIIALSFGVVELRIRCF